MDKERTLYGNLITTPRNLSGTMPGEMIFGVQGPQGPVGPTGLTGPMGPVGPAGKDGTSPIISVQPIASGNIITITNANETITFTVKDGTGVQILGTYENEDALYEEHPTGSVGDSYLVNGMLYIWSANGDSWVNAGSIQGPPGKDGLIGKDGNDGVSATHEWNGTVLTITSASGTSSADLKGRDGNDGVSATHSWNGTTLTVTSASGTSSANLKGADGATPQRGTDYWTAADIAEIKSYVDEAILGGAW